MPSTRRSAVVLVLVVAVAGVLAACGGDDLPGAADLQDEPMPSWVVRVAPGPDATVSGVDTVEVEYDLPTADEGVRLYVDGTDVTAAASHTSNGLHYVSSDGPIVLGTGDHIATVERIRSTTDQSGAEVLDSWSWTFHIT